MSQLKGENPRKQHATSCPELDGKECTCDGFHTFEELYEHRFALFIALCLAIQTLGSHDCCHELPIWRSKLHADGSTYDGWFILGIGKEKSEQITYHLPLSRWEDTDFAETLERAPEWDGHTSADVLQRIKNL